MIVENLLDAAKEVTDENTEIISYIEGVNGKVQVVSRWKILPDGTPYLATVILKPMKQKGNKMEEYEYLENLNSEELAKIIDQMLDFEETTKALMILEEKDSQKALELGKDIIKNNKGDDYLQATVWNVFFFDNQKDMIDVIDKRKEEIGKILLDEIIIDLTKNKVATSKDFLEKLRRTYAAIDNKMNMRCKYEEFLEYGENEKQFG